MRTTAVVIDMLFWQRSLYDRLIRELQEEGDLEAHIIRGSVRADAAWLKLEVRGADRRVLDLLRRWEDSIHSLTRLPQSAA
jgi:hypothetical protein